MSKDAFQPARSRLLHEIEQDFAFTGHMTGHPHLDDRVRAALEAVPREHFIPEYLHGQAYDNNPLPIGHSQTISQPYIVALMSQCLELQPGDRVLEIGTGSGYQAAVLAHLAGEVYSVESIPALGALARERLLALGLENVHTRVGNGCRGWPEAGPFDAIIVTAATRKLPPDLLDQLAAGGRLIAPIGGTFSQNLILYRKDTDGAVEERQLLPVMFVPLVDSAASEADDSE